jgi:hypothetical protein
VVVKSSLSRQLDSTYLGSVMSFEGASFINILVFEEPILKGKITDISRDPRGWHHTALHRYL